MNNTNIMVISGRFKLWDINTDLQSFIKNNKFHTICAINSSEYILSSFTRQDDVKII
jgi:hypothetical protein